DATLDDVLFSISEMGVGHVKQSFYFCEEFDWEETGKIIDAVDRWNLLLIPLLDGCPHDDFTPPTNPRSFANWAGQFAKKHGNGLDYYVIWDEPNLSAHWGNRPVNPSEYAAILSATAAAIKTADPDAVIVASPLAPTVETGPENISDVLYLESLYDAGAGAFFDVAAGKPYGFDSDPFDREVDHDILNFSRIILLRETMERYGDGDKAIWAGNWGWNSLPSQWTGDPSIWGQVAEDTQADWSVEAINRAKEEWPWMGLMFLENFEPLAQSDDPIWGFSIAGRPAQTALGNELPSHSLAYPGFSWADPEAPSQSYQGSWRFSPEFGADVGSSGDSVSFDFWGTEVALNVRRADYHARFYVTIDGDPANQLPNDGEGASLVLNSPIPGDDFVSTELVAANLEPGAHILEATAFRGSDQWALKGFTTGYQPPANVYRVWMIALGLLAILSLIAAIVGATRVDWKDTSTKLSGWLGRLSSRQQLLLTALSALLVVTSGWLTWGEQAAGVYRRLGDTGQLALTAAVASIFYVAPSFFLYIAALVILFVLLVLRPAWGIALVAFSLPYYVKPKPMLGYRFSPVEVFLLLTLSAFITATVIKHLISSARGQTRRRKFRWVNADFAVLAFTLIATLSLIFTERLDVATNEWRVIIIEPAILYALIRVMQLKDREVWTIVDALILGGLVMAVIGLGQYATGQNLITAEGGLMRLRSVYGSPNNVALYLGRLIPILISMGLMGAGRRRIAYSLALIPILLATLLTYSKGSLLLGLPAAIIVVLILWRRAVGGKIWPWLAGLGLLGFVGLITALQIPQIAGRFNPQGETGFFRLSLWRSSLNMLRDHPVFGVGLDNFLYAYRGRYILDSAWQEPNLSHPHNIILDFATRLGFLGLAAGIWMIVSFLWIAIRIQSMVHRLWRPMAIGILGSLVYMLFHGLVDHSFFLVDLAYCFYLLLGLVVWLESNHTGLLQNATKSEVGG
ncbi:MAG TPA: O-antigen ligase family protein, partial [candidate division Zixibacteria bacterium]|nr:O-antigen ligase family protein [candidate division Zixibacteria bacterium]